MSNKDYYRAVLLGVILGIVFITLFYMLGVAFDANPPPKSEPPEKRFEVVDRYKECKVLRWTDTETMSSYKYFLYCGKSK